MVESDSHLNTLASEACVRSIYCAKMCRCSWHPDLNAGNCFVDWALTLRDFLSFDWLLPEVASLYQPDADMNVKQTSCSSKAS